MTEKQKELKEKVKSIKDDEQLIITVLSFAETVEQQQTIIDFIDNAEDVNEENLLVLCVYLDNKKYHPERNLDGNDEF